MEKACLWCSGIVTETYRVNEAGEFFCNDSCYESYYEENDVECKDHSHPYIDDYELIRSSYLDWLANWEEEIMDRGKNYQTSSDHVLQLIDEAMAPYRDYYISGGDDGVFSREIFHYYVKFQELQRRILDWRPPHEDYYYLSFEVTHPLLVTACISGEDFVRFLKDIEEIELYEMLKGHEHPYNHMAFYFDTEEMANAVASKVIQTFGDCVENSLYIDRAWLCDGECYDIEVVGDVDLHRLDGWFFCCSCEDYHPGYFSKESLIREIQLYEEQPTKCTFTIGKIKRSCRYHRVDFPEWV